MSNLFTALMHEKKNCIIKIKITYITFKGKNSQKENYIIGDVLYIADDCSILVGPYIPIRFDELSEPINYLISGRKYISALF